MDGAFGYTWPRSSPAFTRKHLMPDIDPCIASTSRPIPTSTTNMAIVGATGAVGVELLRCLDARGFPLRTLRLFASPRSAGRTLPFQGQEIIVEPLTETSFAGVNIALFSAGSSVSKRYAPVAVQAGAVVVDNSAAFRMHPDVPLVVPEVNAGALAGHRGIIANPNCVAAIAVVALAPLHRAHPIRRLHVATSLPCRRGLYADRPATPLRLQPVQP